MQTPLLLVAPPFCHGTVIPLETYPIPSALGSQIELGQISTGQSDLLGTPGAVLYCNFYLHPRQAHRGYRCQPSAQDSAYRHARAHKRTQGAYCFSEQGLIIYSSVCKHARCPNKAELPSPSRSGTASYRYHTGIIPVPIPTCLLSW